MEKFLKIHRVGKSQSFVLISLQSRNSDRAQNKFEIWRSRIRHKNCELRSWIPREPNLTSWSRMLNVLVTTMRSDNNSGWLHSGPVTPKTWKPTSLYFRDTCVEASKSWGGLKRIPRRRGIPMPKLGVPMVGFGTHSFTCVSTSRILLSRITRVHIC